MIYEWNWQFNETKEEALALWRYINFVLLLLFPLYNSYRTNTAHEQ